MNLIERSSEYKNKNKNNFRNKRRNTSRSIVGKQIQKLER
jgi:hypothetical protein